MNLRKLLIVAACGILTLLVGSATRAEDGHEGWLRYAPLDAAAAKTYASLPRSVRAESDSPVLRSAREELTRGLHGMLGITLVMQAAERSSNRSRHRQKSRCRILPHPLVWREQQAVAPDHRRRRPRRPLRCLRAPQQNRAPRISRESRRNAAPLRPRPLGQRLGQSRRHHRTRLRRPLDFLRRRQRSSRSLARERLRPPARLDRH